MNVLLIIAGFVGVLCGAGLTALLGKSKVLGATVGLIFALGLAVFIIPRMAHPPRCDFGDPIDYPPREKPAGYVYVIQDVDISHYYKIGYTGNLKERIDDYFGVKLPFQTEYVAIIESGDARTLEWQLHQRYAESRKRGEWFDLSRDDVHEICRM